MQWEHIIWFVRLYLCQTFRLIVYFTFGAVPCFVSSIFLYHTIKLCPERCSLISTWTYRLMPTFEFYSKLFYFFFLTIKRYLANYAMMIQNYFFLLFVSFLCELITCNSLLAGRRLRHRSYTEAQVCAWILSSFSYFVWIKNNVMT